MSGALDPIQEDLPFEEAAKSSTSPDPTAGPSPAADSLIEVPLRKAAKPQAPAPPSIYEQVVKRIRALPWAQWRARAVPILRKGAGQLSTVAKAAASEGGSVARVAVKRGGPYAVQLAKATAQISLIRALPLMVARTIHLLGFPAVVLRSALQFSIAHRAGLAIDEVTYFRVDDPAGYTVYEAPARIGTAIAIAYLPALVLWVLAVLCLAQALTPRTVLELPPTWVTWLQIWLGLSFAAHGLPSYEEAGPVAEQARVGVVKADPVSVFWIIPAQIVAVLTRFGSIIPSVAGGAVCWWLAAALIR